MSITTTFEVEQTLSFLGGDLAHRSRRKFQSNFEMASPGG